MAFTHPHLEVPRFIHPGPYALQEIEKKPSARTFSLSDLPRLKNRCKWCNACATRSSRSHYCSEDCVKSAVMFCRPQSPATKMFVLIHLQDCTCVGCGEIFDDALQERATQLWSLVLERQKHGLWEDVTEVSLAMLGDCTGDRWHVDHIIPIFRGGRGVCIENIQVLCVKCHHRKTARERNAS